MKDINLGQFASKFFSYAFTKKAPGAEAQIKVPPKFVPEKPANNQQMITKQLMNLNQDINLARSQLAQLNMLDKNLLLKDLFNLPKDLKDFLFAMSGNNAKNMSNQDIAKMLMNSNLDASKLMQFIQQNGKEALSKLFQMVANYNQLGTAVKQGDLAELTALINACVAGAGEKNSQSLKTIMLMYLPWLPLNDEKAFKLEIAGKDDVEGSRDDAITILISTVKFGNLQITLSKVDKGSIDISINCPKEFPLEKLKLAINEEAVNYSVQTVVNTNIIEDAKNTLKESQLQISMKVSPGVNPFLILMANSVIKVVSEVDNSDNLRQAREEML